MMVYLPSRWQKGCCQICLCHHRISQQRHRHSHDLGGPLWHLDSHDTLPSCSWQEDCSNSFKELGMRLMSCINTEMLAKLTLSAMRSTVCGMQSR